MFGWFGRVSYVPHTRTDAFAGHLKEGRLVASQCRGCAERSFPPRADCPRCLSPEFELVEIGGAAHLLSHTRIHAAPSGFERVAPYTVGVAELDELGPAGRVMAWLGESIAAGEAEIGMRVQVVPRVIEEIEELRVEYTLERSAAPAGQAGGETT